MPRVLSATVDAIAPARLGRSFRSILAAVLTTNIGDGIVVAAGPLLVASLTRDPFLVSLAFLCEFLPAMFFGTIAGVVVDRVDRRRVVVLVNVFRAGMLTLLAITIATGSISIPIIFGTLLVIGTAETFADLASSSLLPRIVPRAHLGVANARMSGSYLLANQLLGPPIGAFLFVAGMAIPFIADAVCYALGAVIVARIAASDVSPRAAPARATTGATQVALPDVDTADADAAADAADEAATVVRAAKPTRGRVKAAFDDFLEGVRWLRAHPPMRTLVLTIVAFNVTWGAAWSVLVLYATDRLGMDSIGFGLLTTAMAIGGVIGTTSYPWLERHFSLANLMRGGLIIETVTHLILAVTQVPIVALGVMVVFGAHAFVWVTTSTTIRQRAVPDSLLGRVGGIYGVGVNLGIVIGTPVGGLLARQLGVTAPFWFAFIGSALLVAVMWREFTHIAHAGEAGPEPAPA